MESVRVVNLMKEFTKTFGGKPGLLKAAVAHIKTSLNLDFLTYAEHRHKKERKTSGAKKTLKLQDAN